jgi:hypothetical protein
MLAPAQVAVSPPSIQYSQGSGDAFFIFASTGSSAVGLAIYRGDNAGLLCAGPSPVVPSGQLVGEATATQVRIKAGGTVLAACPRPASVRS